METVVNEDPAAQEQPAQNQQQQADQQQEATNPAQPAQTEAPTPTAEKPANPNDIPAQADSPLPAADLPAAASAVRTEIYYTRSGDLTIKYEITTGDILVSVLLSSLIVLLIVGQLHRLILGGKR